MKKINVILIFLSLFIFSSCDLYKIWDDGQLSFEIINNTDSQIVIESFENTVSVDKFQVEPNSSVIKYANNRDSNPSFVPSDRIDSMVVSKVNGNDYIVYHCPGTDLFGVGGNNCPELLGKLPTMFFSENCESIDKVIKGRRILSKCTAEINEVDFNR